VPRTRDTPDGGGTRRTTTRTAASGAATGRRGGARSRAAAVDEDLPATSGRPGLGGLLRGPAGAVFGGLSGIDGASRSLDRLSRAAERGADFLDRLDAEVGMERALELVDRLETLVEAVEGVHRSMLAIEAMVADVHQHLLPSAPRGRRARR
jgi:hypothetical protein